MQITLSKFGGLNTNLAPYMLPEGKAQDLYDVRNREGTLGKRAGAVRKNATAGPSSPMGVYSHVTEAGTVTRLIFQNGASYKLASGTMSAISSGNFGTGPFKCCTLRGLTVIAGTSKVSVFKSDSVFGELTEPQPAAGSAATGTGSLAAGVYTYWFVLYSTELAQYGSPLGTSFTFTSVGTAPAISRGTVSTTGIWDRIAVFRSTVGGATPLLVGLKSNGDFSFNDTTTDANLGAAFSPTDAIDLTDATDCLVRDDRVFLIRNNDRAVYYTESGKVSMISALGFLTALGGTEVPVALAATLSSIFVLGRNSIWLIAGNTSDTYSIARVVNGIGCVDRRSVQVFNDKIYFKGKLGYYEFDGINPPVLISIDIDDLARGLSDSLYTAIDTQSGEYKVFYPGTYGDGDISYSYDCNAKEWWRDRVPARVGGMMRSNGDDTQEVFATVDRLGYLHEHSDDVAYDGISSGTLDGTATSGSTTTLGMTSASFYTTGGGLAGMILEVKHGTTVERREIASNTGTGITVSSAFSFTVTAGDTFVIGGISSYWHSGRLGLSTMSRWKLLECHFESQSAGTLEVNWDIDAGGFVDATKEMSMTSLVYGRAWIGRYGRSAAFRFRCRGNAKPFALARVDIEVEKNVG